jgi:hypothetical protein
MGGPGRPRARDAGRGKDSATRSGRIASDKGGGVRRIVSLVIFHDDDDEDDDEDDDGRRGK